MDGRVQRFFKGMQGKKITFCGMGRSNLPLIELFARAGAIVTACDRDAKNKLGDMQKCLTAKGIACKRGEDYLTDLDVDIIFRTPGMKFLTPELDAYRKKGVVVTSEMEVFFDLCPATLFAVTGSDGKTTTTALIAQLLKAAGKTVHLGGNIGHPLLPLIGRMKATDYAVAELSSFQLISMRKSPDVAVVTNIAPNHLDVHKDMGEYVNAKRNIYLHQNAFSKTVLNCDNEITMGFADEARGNVSFFSRRHSVETGAYMDENGDIFYIDHSGNKTRIMNRADILLPGLHNVENTLAAICAVWGIVAPAQIKRVAQIFCGVEHRTEFVRKVNGVSYYNDSIATSPTRTIQGTLSLYPQKIILLAGGSDKNIPFDALGSAICDHVKALILMGATADHIKRAVLSSDNYTGGNPVIIEAASMEDAVLQARGLAQPGDVVSLSPACASFDWYDDFEHRGNHFKQLVRDL